MRAPLKLGRHMSPVGDPRFISRVLESFDAEPRDAKTLHVGDSGLSKELFQRRVLSSPEPLLVKHALSPARLASWSPENLRAFLGRQLGTLWITRGVADQGASRFEEISARDYADYLFDDQARAKADAADADPMYVSISKEFMRMLPDMARELGLDALIPRLYSRYPYAFLGPDQTISGLHFDSYHSLFTQVWGDKIFLLFPPADTPNLYPSKKYDWASTLSRVDLRQVESNRRAFPLLRRCTPYSARVATADLLWIPSGWFHFVYAMVPSFSVTFFLASPWRWLSYGIWEDWFKVALHHLGVLGRRHGCTCHEGSLS
ncbi:MAG TPA: cupin-like domain-containing protein [Myxococcota bacterium]|nr:cupin-like domain-containing protein [Myxococcota bacterium]